MCHSEEDDGKPVDDVYSLEEWKADRGKKLEKFNDIKFSHKHHEDKEVKCADCHNDIAGSDKVAARHTASANTCVKCHGTWLNESRCDKCHFKTRKEKMPEYHKRPDFMQTHGQHLNNQPFDNWVEGTGKHNRLCFECHKQDKCIQCHNEKEPRDHTNQWRNIGHGISAGINRSRCQTCHRVDFCVRCHEQTRPRSHVANWGSTRSRHCAYCHEPVSSTSCFMCHKDTPSHNAQDAPPFVQEGWPCRRCHYTYVPLDHFDNGEDCEHCHSIVAEPEAAGRKKRRILGRMRR